MRTFKVLGGPGCGKTTEILNRLGRKFREGLNPSQVLMIGFAKATVENLRERAIEELKFTESQAESIQTIHKYCLDRLPIKNVFTSEYKRDFKNKLKQQGWVGADDSVRTKEAIRSIEDRFLIRDAMNTGQTRMYQFDEVPYNQQVYLSKESGKYQKLAPDVEGQFKGIRSFVGVGPRLAKAAQKMNIANQATMTASMLATGNVPGAVVSGVGLAASVGAQNRTVQKKFAKLVTRIAAERGAKSTAKLIPGVDIALTAGEVYSYLSEGKLDQAAIATIGGAIGWIPGAGDFGQALLDGINTAIDVSRMDYNQRDQELDLDRLDKNKVKGSNVENFIGVRSSTPRPRFRLTY